MSCKVAEDAWFHISAVVYTKKRPAAGDAAASDCAVIPEIKRQNWLCCTIVPYGYAQLVALFRCRHEIYVRVVAPRYIEEQLTIECAFGYQQVNPFFRNYGINVVPGHKGGKAKDTTFFP